uniref:Cyclic nucleotide-binding domain-containing protein n=2 Tax=Callorhinchus milii TaxID=7868 RepID=A0A4W3HTE3_CALMI
MILNELSQALREEVINHNCSRLMANVPFFKNCDENFMNSLLSKLKFHVCQSANVIYHKGAIGRYMLFIEKGIMVSEGDNISKKLTDGDFIGEMSILTDKVREATVTATTPCRFYTISKDDFNETLELYPKMNEHFERIVAERQEELQDS